EDDADAVILIRDGLPAVRQADDAQPARGERHPRAFEEAVLVRPAVVECRRHRPQGPCRRRPPPPRQINDPPHPTHASVLPGLPFRVPPPGLPIPERTAASPCAPAGSPPGGGRGG